MIKEFQAQNLDILMDICLNANISAHSFIDKSYWENTFGTVRSLLPNADLHVYEENNSIKGFIGVINSSYIAGLFVKNEYQLKGIGKNC